MRGPWVAGLKPDLPVTSAAAITLQARIRPVAELLARVDRGLSVRRVHELRVACRRASAAIELYRDLLPNRPARWWLQRLRKIRKAAGALRAFDVLHHRIENEHSGKPAQSQFKQKRRVLAEETLERLQQLSHPRRYESRLAELVDSITWSPGEPPPQREWVRASLAAALEDFLAAEPAERDDLAALHRFRIAGKRLRYTLELIGDGGGPAVRELYPDVEALQSLLGGIQDGRDACRHFGRSIEDRTSVADIQQVVQQLESEANRLWEQVQAFWNAWKPVRQTIVRLQRSTKRGA